jgi:hypothetical protein
MAIDMLTHLSSLLNRQIHSHETLNTYFSKIEALLEIAMGEDFLRCSESTAHDYLWTVNDLVEQAKGYNQDSLSSLLSNSDKKD